MHVATTSDVAGVAKLRLSNGKTQLKLIETTPAPASKVVVLNHVYAESTPPSSLEILDTDGDAVTVESFSGIGVGYFIGYSGKRFQCTESLPSSDELIWDNNQKSQSISAADLALETARKRRRFYMLPPPEQPQHWIGRTRAENVIRHVAEQNYIHRTATDHATFSFLMASGHVRIGKTRSGIETPRIVGRLCEQIESQEKGDRFSNPVYLRIDFLNGARFDSQFDSLTRPPSVALGARLICAFYEESVLHQVDHQVALHNIVRHVQGDNRDLIPDYNSH